MATLISRASGNWSSASTWALADTTSALISESNSTALTTSYVSSSTFTPGAIEIDAILVSVRSKNAATTQTVSVALDQGGSTVSGTEVTIDSIDLEWSGYATSNAVYHHKWVLFKFAAPVTLVDATAYSVKAKCSANSHISLYRDATTNNFSRLLRTTTQSSGPTTGDNLYVMGEKTGQGTANTLTVTMDSTSSTDYGSSATTDGSVPALYIGYNGILTWGTAESTAYVLRLSNWLMIGGTGILRIGTPGTPIPRSSTATLEFDCPSNTAYGLCGFAGSTLVIQGQSRTSGKNVSWTYLTADASGGAGSVTVAADTGWKSGDSIVIAGTTNIYPTNVPEVHTLNGDAGTSTLTLTGTLSSAKSGTAPLQAEVVLLTRNVVVKPVNTSYKAFVTSYGNVDLDWVQFTYLGSSTADRTGVVCLATEVNTFTAHHCSSDNCGYYGFYIKSTTAENFVLDNCVCYKSAGTGFVSVSTASSNWGTISNCVSLGNTTNHGFNTRHCHVTGCRAAQNQYGGFVIDAVPVDLSSLTFTNNIAHNNAQYGFGWYNGGASGEFIGLVLSGLYAIRNGTNGFDMLMGATVARNWTIDNCHFIANLGTNYAGFRWGESSGNATCELTGVIKNCTFRSDATFSQYRGLDFSSAAAGTTNFARFDLYVDSCEFGQTYAHTTADVYFHTTGDGISGQIVFRNCLFGSSTKIGTPVLATHGMIRAARFNRTDGDHRFWKRYGSGQSDSTTYRTAAPALKLTPTSATNKLESSPILVPVGDGIRKTIAVYVRKNSSYTGNAPRLVLKADPALGITSDVVLDTLSVGADTWEQLIGTSTETIDAGLLEAVVDCDGTAGAVFVDDATAYTAFTHTATVSGGLTAGGAATIDYLSQDDSMQYWIDGLADEVMGGTSEVWIDGVPLIDQ